MIRNIFELLLSNEVKQMNVDGGIVMVYHSNYKPGTYKAGSFVRYDNGTSFDMKIAVKDTSLDPSTSDWETVGVGVALPRGSMIDNGGLQMVDSNGDILKVV